MGKGKEESYYYVLKGVVEGLKENEQRTYEHEGLGLRYRVSRNSIELSPLKTLTENIERIVFQSTPGVVQYVRKVSAESLALLSDPQKTITTIDHMISEPFDKRSEDIFRMIHEGLKDATRIDTQK